MLANRLTERIKIQRKTQSKNEFRGNVDSWEDVVEISAEKRYLSGSEILNRGLVNTSIVEFYIRHREDIDYSCRAIWNNEVYNIQDIEPIGRKETIRLRCNRQ